MLQEFTKRMRKFYFKYIGEAFVLCRDQQLDDIVTKIEVETEILPLRSLSRKKVNAIIDLQGRWSSLYLRFVFGSEETYLALVWAGKQLAHVAWITPYEKCRERFPFIPEKAYMIGPCQTLPSFRGNMIYPFVLQQITHSVPECDEYWILVHEKNLSSIRGIKKAGSKHMGRFVQKRWLWNCLRSTKYYPDAS